MLIPAGHKLVTGYVPTAEIVFPMTGKPMAVASVEAKIRDRTGNPQGEFYPVPIGRWEAGRFHLWDGRHRYIAALMTGHTPMLVGWMEKADA